MNHIISFKWNIIELPDENDGREFGWYFELVNPKTEKELFVSDWFAIEDDAWDSSIGRYILENDPLMLS